MAQLEGSEMRDALGEDALVALRRYADTDRAAFMQVVGELFDIPGEQKATAAKPIEIVKLGMKDSHVVARVQLRITYRSPIEAGDPDLGAENATTDSIDVRFVEQGADLTVEGIEAVVGEAFAG